MEELTMKQRLLVWLLLLLLRASALTSLPLPLLALAARSDD